MPQDASLVILLPRFLIRLDVSIQHIARYFGACYDIFVSREEPRLLQTTGCINSKIVYTPLEARPKQMSVIRV